MRFWMIGVMAALLATAGCQRREAEPTETPATPAPSTPIVTERPESRTLAAVKRRGRLNCGVHQGLSLIHI